MNFNEYQKQARTTAIYKNKPYFAIGLVGEAGELANAMKKVMRDDANKITAKRRLAIKGELGDVLWYCANICEEFNLNMQDLTILCSQGLIVEQPLKNKFKLVLEIHRNAVNVSRLIEESIETQDIDKELLQRFLSDLFIALDDFCHTCAIDINIAAEENLEKLLSRQQRGVIQGEGDTR